MDENRVEGGLRQAGGRLQDAVGGLTGDAATQIRGKANQAAGYAQRAYGNTIDGARDFAVDSPATALLTAGGVGLLLGLLLARR